MKRVDVKRRASLFDSKAESDLFVELESRWNPKLRLFPQLPLRNLLEASDDEFAAMKPSHLQYFRSAAVDFTFASETGEPFLSIEFDGIGGGFGQGVRYVQARPTPDPNRDWKMNFKLRAAARARYPLFVVSFDETDYLDEEESITIVDGIVGQLLSQRQERILLEQMVADDQDQIDQLPPWEASDHIQDLAIQASVFAELEHDPLAVAIGRESEDLFKRFGLGTGESHHPWLYDPPLPDTESFPPSLDVLAARAEARKSAGRVGARVGVSTGTGTDEHDYVYETVWIRNLGWNHGLMPELIAEQLAHLGALRKLRSAAERGEIAPVTA